MGDGVVSGVRLRRRALSVVAAVLLVSVAGILGAATPVAAAGSIQFDGSPGSAAPPSTLGPFSMTPFGDDGRPTHANVTTVPAPTGGVLTFDRPAAHEKIGDGWGNWSHGYTGDIYCTTAVNCTSGTPGPGEESLVMTLPANTFAFYFYAESDKFATFHFTATAQDGTSSGAVPVTTPAGAKYFGFFSTDPSNPIVTITVTTDLTPTDFGFAVGEFGISDQVPAPVTPAPTPATTQAPTPAPAVVAVTPRFTG